MTAIKTTLEQLKSNPGLLPELSGRVIYKGINQQIAEQLNAAKAQVYHGKVREVIRRGEKLWMNHTDRLSAFDRPIGLVPFKGQILTTLSTFWFEQMTQAGIPNHYLGTVDSRTLSVKATTPFKIEVIVRAYLAGSIMRAYQNGSRFFCGVELPHGLEAFGPLPSLLITPTTKAEVYEHDEDTSPKELIAKGVCTASEWAEISTRALELFNLGQKIVADKGFILVDTKYEFGRTATGEIVVIDEVHTPDSTRFWLAASYEERRKRQDVPEMLDKETVRRYLMEQGFSGHGPVPHVPLDRLVSVAGTYLSAAETITGKTLQVDAVDYQFPLARFLES